MHDSRHRAGLALCLALAGCATATAPDTGPSAGFGLDSPVRELVASVSPSGPAERGLRAYALRIQTLGAGPETRVDVLGRQAWRPGGILVAVTGSQGAGVFGMSRSIGLCGLVSLRLDATITDQAWLPGDPSRAPLDEVGFTDEVRLDPLTRMQVTHLRVDGRPCSPQPDAGFSLVLETRSSQAGQGTGVGTTLAGQVRYDCRAGPGFEPASRLHPRLPGAMLRVDCRRSGTAARSGGQLAYAWIASSGVYLLTEHRGQDIAQRYVYTDVVLDP